MKLKEYPTIQVSIKNVIELKCGECCGFDWNLVIECADFLCPLHSYRPRGRKDSLKAKFWDEDKICFKARPSVKKRTKQVTEEQKLAASERFKKMWKEKKKDA